MIVFASAPPVWVQPERENPWPGCTLTWTAPDQLTGEPTVWDLTSGLQGVTAMAGTNLLGPPEFELYEDEFAGQQGSRFRGSRALPRDGLLPVRVKNVPGVHKGTLGFIDLDSQFWRTLDPSQTGVLRFTRPGGRWRELRLRYNGLANPEVDTEASLVGREVYGLRFRSHQPYWEGAPVTSLWSARPPEQFFVGPNEGPGQVVVRISSSFTLDTATITNPGETAAHIEWIGQGPFARIKVGAEGKTVELPTAVPRGKAVVINTREKTAIIYTVTAAGSLKDADRWDIGTDLVDPVDVTKQLGAASFAPVKPGANIKLSLELPGNIEGIGAVAARLTPLYKRAR